MNEPVMLTQIARPTWYIGSAVLLVVFGSYQTVSGKEAPVPKHDQKVQVYSKDALSSPQIGYMAGIKNGVLYLTSGGEFTINGAITNAGDSLSFPYGGARYNSKTDTLSGIDINGDTLRYLLEDISSIQVQFLKANAQPKTTLDRSTARRRLQFGAKYPDVRMVPIDSIQQLKVWHRTSVLAPVLSVLAGVIGGAVLATGETPDTSFEVHQMIIWGIPATWVDTIVHKEDPKMLLDFFVGASIGVAVAYLLGRGHWKEIEVEKSAISLMPLYRRNPGLSLSVRF
jgi:hypothetical protein